MSANKKLIILTIFMGAILVYSLFLPDEADTPKGKQSSEIETKVSMGQICFPEYNPSDGKLLFNQIQQKYKDCDLSPMLTSDYKVKYCLIIPIPTDEYHCLSIEERKKIMNYVSSLIPDAKKNYGRYLILSPSSPVFKTNVFEKYTKIMNYRCCAIAIGPIEKDYYYKAGSGERVYGGFVAEEQLIYPDDLE